MYCSFTRLTIAVIFITPDNREVDPFGNHPAQKTTMGLPDGARYEAVACDARKPNRVQCFATHDAPDGEITMFVPNRRLAKKALQRRDGDNSWDVLAAPPSKRKYLKLRKDGTFRWTNSLKRGKENASRYYPRSEGMEIVDNMLMFVASDNQQLFVLDLDTQTYHIRSTNSGLFTGEPDQVVHLNDHHLYFSEEKRDDSAGGVFGMSMDGANMFTLFLSELHGGDINGIALSPDGMFMYCSFQDAGLVYSIWREDALPFSGKVASVQHHERRKRVR
jgi:secreted PhoX family phosphatase